MHTRNPLRRTPLPNINRRMPLSFRTKLYVLNTPHLISLISRLTKGQFRFSAEEVQDDLAVGVIDHAVAIRVHV